jgi:hypothetical protein
VFKLVWLKFWPVVQVVPLVPIKLSWNPGVCPIVLVVVKGNVDVPMLKLSPTSGIVLVVEVIGIVVSFIKRLSLVIKFVPVVIGTVVVSGVVDV